MSGLPLALVTGFLGSGKTTLLEQAAKRYCGRKIVFLINEFSTTDVDGARLRRETPDVEVVAGGSIFCRCLVSEFIGRLAELPARFGTPAAPVEGVVIEASGMTDPRAAGTLLAESRLDRVYELREILAIVDPGSLLKLLHTLPNIRTQIEVARRILINKTDLYSPSQVEQAETAVRAINPAAVILRTSFCRADLDLFPSIVLPPPRGQYAPCADPRYERFIVPSEGEFDAGRFGRTLERLAGDIYRVKGFVRMDGLTRYLDYSAAGLRFEEASPEMPIELVFILRGPSTEPARRLVEDVKRGHFRRSTP
jgi:G3E family GTPase